MRAHWRCHQNDVCIVTGAGDDVASAVGRGVPRPGWGVPRESGPSVSEVPGSAVALGSAVWVPVGRGVARPGVAEGRGPVAGVAEDVGDGSAVAVRLGVTRGVAVGSGSPVNRGSAPMVSPS